MSEHQNAFNYPETPYIVIYSRPRVALPSTASNVTFGREQRYLRPRVDNMSYFQDRLLAFWGEFAIALTAW